MASIIVLLIVGLIDPVRWVVCGLIGWFTPSLFVAIAIALTVTSGVIIVLGGPNSGILLFANAVTSPIMVYVIHSWRARRRRKAQVTAHESTTV